MQTIPRSLILISLAAGCALAAPNRRSKATEVPKPPPAETVLPQPIEPPGTPAAPATARVVTYGERDVVQVKAKLRFTTLIVLPRGERILDFTCGDKEFWIVNGNENFAYIKPAKAASQTNLNLITASGNVFSFVLAEVSNESSTEPDLKIFVEPKEDALRIAPSKAPAFVSAQDAEDYRRQVELAREETRRVKTSMQETIDRGISKFITNVRFPYEFQAGKKPFHVRAMYHDERFTYIQARPEETATLYEIKDGKPNLVNFEYKDGVYVVDKVLDRGYLMVGKAKLPFSRND